MLSDWQGKAAAGVIVLALAAMAFENFKSHTHPTGCKAVELETVTICSEERDSLRYDEGTVRESEFTEGENLKICRAIAKRVQISCQDNTGG